MARVDHEAAWVELGEHVAAKTQHGQHELLRKMAELAAKHVVSESLLERAVRIFGLPMLVDFARGVLVERSPSQTPEAETSGEPDSLRAAMPADPGPPMTEGGHDGSNAHAGSGRNGRR